MLRQLKDRWVLRCDACPAQLDLAPAVRPRAGLRMPSGWLILGRDQTACAICARSHMGVFAKKTVRGGALRERLTAPAAAAGLQPSNKLRADQPF